MDQQTPRDRLTTHQFSPLQVTTAPQSPPQPLLPPTLASHNARATHLASSTLLSTTSASSSAPPLLVVRLPHKPTMLPRTWSQLATQLQSLPQPSLPSSSASLLARATASALLTLSFLVFASSSTKHLLQESHQIWESLI